MTDQTPQQQNTQQKTQITDSKNGGISVQIPLDVLRRKKLFVATPMYGGQCAGMYCQSSCNLTGLCTRHNIPLQWYYLFNESLITRARNYCADEFMRSGATNMLFIDSDIGFNPQDVLALLGLQSDESDFDIIAAPYPKKTISWEKIKAAVDKGFAEKDPRNLENFVGDFVFNPVPGTKEIHIGRPQEVLETGTGFMMIRRKTFEVISKARPDLMYKPDHVRTKEFDGSREIMMYFQADIDLERLDVIYREVLGNISHGGTLEDVKKLAEEALQLKAKGTKRYLSEDYLFCQLARSLGLKVWLCPWIQLKHVGNFIFGGSLSALAAAGVSATADSSAIKK